MNEITIDEKKYPLVADDLLPAGKRGIVRSYRATNGTDASRVKRVEYRLDGPIGNSLESVSGTLGVDFTQNIETRFPRRIMSVGKRTAVTVSSSSSSSFSTVTTSAKFGAFKFGSTTTKFGGTEALFGSSGTSGDVVRFFDEQLGYLYAHHGAVSTEFGPLSSGFTIVDSETHPAIVTGVAQWGNFGFIGLGGTELALQRLQGTSGVAVYQQILNITGLSIYIKNLALGSDRLWYINEDNAVGYTFDEFRSIAHPFQVGDATKNGNGIGTHGPYAYVGQTNSITAFTDQGKPVPLSRALLNHESTNNGTQFADPGWGWLYTITDIGLRAIRGHTDNPAGLGERMREFTGHTGRPTAVYAYRGELLVAYKTVAGHTFLYRGLFSDETEATGQPDWYPFRYLTSTECGAFFASNTPSNPVIIWGEDGDIAYETISRDGRDDLFAARLYSTTGGIWYGTTLDRDPHLLKTLRLARCRVLNVEYCSDWQLAVSFDLDPWDADPEYIDIGPLMDVPGQHTLRANSGPDGQPLHNISGRNFKPRLTQRAEGVNAETLPPEVNGTLEIEYDERPAYIEEVVVQLQAGTGPKATVDALVKLSEETTNGPVKVRFPGAREDSWAMVAGVENRRDLKGDGVESVEVTLQVWEVA